MLTICIYSLATVSMFMFLDVLPAVKRKHHFAAALRNVVKHSIALPASEFHSSWLWIIKYF